MVKYMLYDYKIVIAVSLTTQNEVFEVEQA